MIDSYIPDATMGHKGGAGVTAAQMGTLLSGQTLHSKEEILLVRWLP